MVGKTPTIKLNSGYKMPILGLGTYNGKAKPGEVTQAVKDAIDVGFRHIDCAMVYENEKEVGFALKAKFDEGIIKRQDIFITSKLWNTFHRKELVVPSLKKSLENLGLNYIDLYLVHWPMAFKEGSEIFPEDEHGKTLYEDTDYIQTWAGMEDCSKAGLTKSIGVSNFNRDQIERLINNSTIIPANNQVECHPHLNQKRLIEYCKSKGISLTANSPLGSPDRSWAKPGEMNILDDPKVVELSANLNMSPAQLAIRYQIERGIIVIPKSSNKTRLAENFKVLDLNLTAETVSILDSFDCNRRAMLLEWNKDHKYWPFHEDF